MKTQKLEFLRYLSKKYNISENETCAIGDGANDIKVIKMYLWALATEVKKF